MLKVNKKGINLSLETVVIMLIILVVAFLLVYFSIKYIPDLFNSFRQQGSNAAALAKDVNIPKP